jgi:hypothetical protein
MDATPMPIMDNSTLRTFYLADGASVDRTIKSYPDLVQHLLKVYAAESAMMRAQATFYQTMQRPGEGVPVFASLLQEQASLLGHSTQLKS